MQSPTEINLRQVLEGHKASVNVVEFDNKYIVSGSGDRTLRVWNTNTCEFVRALKGHKRGIACLQYRDRMVASGSSDKTIRYITGLNVSCHCIRPQWDCLVTVDLASWIFIMFRGKLNSPISSSNKKGKRKGFTVGMVLRERENATKTATIFD